MNQTRILITDDDDDDRLFLRKAIERRIKEAIVYEALDGADALRQLATPLNRPNFDLVLLDINMPLMNGFEVLDQIRASPDLKYMPTVMLSTSNHPEQIHSAYKKGVNAYLKKPITYADYDALVVAIETCFLKVASE
ncbi:response regulator [Spirosoma foliorum]|uniref:Response regulator n=1 Tax=Spirosoma foliorum TaxID=2710596 RepID=A0A7G5GQ89_9BACT|nr:response regulator [Spirosoma foliorum]QMW01031.1 response regulator [Spirosoma foliorum]